MTETPIALHGNLVSVRDFALDDTEAAHSIVGDDRVTRWLSFDARDRAGTALMIRSAIRTAQEIPRAEYYCAVEPIGQRALVGFVRLALGAHSTAKLGYAIHSDHWGHGYATDAAATLLGFGFHDLGLHRITAAVGPDNTASIAVLEHLGFLREGRLRDHVFANGAWRDSLLYSILAHEY